MPSNPRGMGIRFRTTVTIPERNRGRSGATTPPRHPFSVRRSRPPIEEDEPSRDEPVDFGMIEDLAQTGELAKYLFIQEMKKLGLRIPSFMPGPTAPPAGILGGGRSGRGGGRSPFYKNPKLGEDALFEREELLSDLQIELELVPLLADARGAIESELRVAVRESAFELRDAVVEDFGLSVSPAPPGRPPAIDSGRLADSIAVAFDAGGLGATVGTDVVYAPFLEFGTLEMPARPFLFPAFDRMEERIVRKITDAGARALRRPGAAMGV